jgi:hypothetical protein
MPAFGLLTQPCFIDTLPYNRLIHAGKVGMPMFADQFAQNQGRTVLVAVCS